MAASSFLPQAGRFQSTHPRGVRRGLQLYLCQGFFISIHAPTRGATKYPVLLFLFSSAFQSTHPRGVRLIVIGFLVFVSVFQSTHPRGVRHDYLSSHQIAVEFQSTHPRGVRPILSSISSLGLPISIHAPTRGATPSWRCWSDSELKFQSTHPRGVRHAR